MDERYTRLRLLSSMYFSCQEFRKAMANKTRSGTVDAIVAMAVKAYETQEKAVGREMARELIATAPKQTLAWIEASPGIGEQTMARLIGIIGDPYTACPMRWEQRPDAKGGSDDPKRILVADGEPYIRNVAKLWAYCGFGDPKRKRRAGITAEEGAALGNPKAKTIVFLMADSCLKEAGSRRKKGMPPGYYAEVYEAARERYADRVHVENCPQCKGSSKPGEPWRPGHQHTAAMRKVAKEILRDLWESARDAHMETNPGCTADQHRCAAGSQGMRDTHEKTAAGGQPPNESHQLVAAGSQVDTVAHSADAAGSQAGNDTHMAAAAGSHDTDDDHHEPATGNSKILSWPG